MSEKISQKEYLKKYLRGSTKKKLRTSKKLKVLDGNLSYNEWCSAENVEDAELTGEYAPQIVNIISEEQGIQPIFETKCVKWKSIGTNQKIKEPDVRLSVFLTKNNIEDKCEKIYPATQHIKSKDLYAIPSEKKNIADLSPPRKNVRNAITDNVHNVSQPKKRKNTRLVDKAKINNNVHGSPLILGQVADISEDRSNKKYCRDSSKKESSDSDVPNINPLVHDSTNKTSENGKDKEQKLEKTKYLYRNWGKGLRQVENHNIQNGLDNYESGKPLARYSNDKDLDNFLKEQDRHGDPMLDYINKKCKKTTAHTSVYRGIISENRYNIKPGYRWDGVDRSNGYEKKLFDQQSKRITNLSQSYAIGSEDL